MPKETSMSVRLTLNVEPEQLGAEQRFKVTTAFSATDAGLPFTDQTNTWHYMTEDNVDYVLSLFDDTFGEDGQIEENGVSYARLVELEDKGIKLLEHLNDLGKQMIGKTKPEKDRLIAQLVEARGGKGKLRKKVK